MLFLEHEIKKAFFSDLYLPTAKFPFLCFYNYYTFLWHQRLDDNVLYMEYKKSTEKSKLLKTQRADTEPSVTQ